MDDVVRAIVKILKSKTINLAELMDISVKLLAIPKMTGRNSLNE